MQPNDTIGDYTIAGRIGEGGMSVVYLAHHARGGDVVIKQLQQHLAIDKQLVDRFVQSAQIMRDLRHPHLARVIDYMERHGSYFLIEEYLAGGSVAERIDRQAQYSLNDAVIWCRDVLRAVNYAHEHGIIHRDLKPGNLMLDDRNSIKVTDFGIARVFGGPRLTRTGREMGSPAYMSPEQIRTPYDVDHLTDVYSMGVVLYELLTRRVPFDGDTDFEVKSKVVRDAPVPPRRVDPTIPPAIEEVVLTAMSKDPAERFGGCAEFALRLEECLAPPRRVPRTPTPRPAPSQARPTDTDLGGVTTHPEYAALAALRPPPGPLYARLTAAFWRRLLVTFGLAALLVFWFVARADAMRYVSDTEQTAFLLALAALAIAMLMTAWAVLRVVAFGIRRPKVMPARVVEKRYAVRRGRRPDRHTHYYVMLQLKGAERHEYEASGALYDDVSKGDVGVAYTRGRLLLDYRPLPVSAG
jgi:serine/threonine-protein kinase